MIKRERVKTALKAFTYSYIDILGCDKVVEVVAIMVVLILALAKVMVDSSASADKEVGYDFIYIDWSVIDKVDNDSDIDNDDTDEYVEIDKSGDGREFVV